MSSPLLYQVGLMTTSTIQQLNALNTHFYKTVATAFSGSRSQAWEGWTRLNSSLEPLFQAGSSTILDIGCGNGRFGAFLEASFPLAQFHYTGVDNNLELLRLAQQKLASATPAHSFEFRETNLVESLITKGNCLPTGSYSLIVAFGVLHHIPSLSLRKKFFQNIEEGLDENGIAVISLWQFPRIPSLMQRAVSAKSAGISSENLEPDDYFLTWERDQHAVRYCHYVNDDEEKELLEATSLIVHSSFFADGKTGELNHYLVLQKRKD